MTTTDRPPEVGAGDELAAAEPARAPAYNLAERIYARSNGGPPEGNGELPAALESLPAEERYNLAERVYTQGQNGAAAITTLEPPPELTAETAPAGMPPPGGGGAAGGRGSGGRFSLRIFSTLVEVPSFRWYMLAAFGSFMVMNMQMLVRGYLVYDMTGSFALLGGVALANAIPGLALTMVGGVVADRAPKKYVVQIGQSLSALLALGIGVLLFFDMLRIEHLFISSAFQGAIFAIMMPARQAWLPEVVGIQRLMQAIPLNTAVMTGTRLIGPTIGGLMLAVTGPEYIYFAMTGLYIWSVVMLARVPLRSPQAMTMPAGTSAMGLARGAMGNGAGGAAVATGRGAVGPTAPGMRGGRASGGLSDILAGIRYIATHRVLRMLLVVNLVTVMLAMPYMMMLPGWVLDVLDGNPEQIGYLQSIGAIGALAGALFVATLPNHGRGKYYLAGSLFMGLVLLGYSQTTMFWVAAGLMVLVNFGSTLRQSISQVLIQSYVEDEYRGRVMSIYMMQMSVMQFGSFGVGILAEIAGAQSALLYISAALVIFATSMLLFVPSLRHLD
jgi:MFS family permease